MSSHDTLLFATTHSGGPMSQSETRQQHGSHKTSTKYEPLPLASGDSVPIDSSSTSSTAYEPSHLESNPKIRSSLSFTKLSSAGLPTGSWILEIVAIVVSVGAIVAIVALLHRQNGRPVSDWKLSVTLNTVIAALGTLARTTLAFALSACIGQQKWNWLRRKPDGLVAWERFDEASRGPWGGTRLFVWLRARHWAALGALVTVGAIAFDPFLQAVISTHGQLDSILANADATIGQSSRIDSGYIQQIAGAAQRDRDTGLMYIMTIGSRADFGFISSVYNGFQNTSNFRNDAIGAECSTGNCTWPVFTSAAVCSACEDVSSYITRHQFYGINGTNIPTTTNTYEGHFIKFELPYANIRNYVGLIEEGQTADSQVGGARTYMTANTTVDANRTIAFQHVETLLMAFTMMKAPEDWLQSHIKWEDAKPTGTECALYLCANAYESRSENNLVKEQIIGTWTQKAPDSYGVNTSAWNYEAGTGSAQAWIESLGSRLYDARIDRTDLQLLIPPEESNDLPPDVSREFNVSHAFIYSAIDFLVEYTKGGNEPRNNPANIAKGPPDETWNMMGVPWTTTSQPAVLDALWNSTNLTLTFDNVAKSLTNQIRNSSPDRHQGELQKWVLHVHVDWAYLAYPLSMLVAGILYVVLTIVESSRLRMPVWKESALPTLLHGFDDETQRLLRADSKDAQRRVLVRFDQDEEGSMRLMTHS